MGKYGSAVSMKDVIRMEVEEVEEILKGTKMPDEDKTRIVDALKEMAYQWCSCNASACAFEGAVKSLLPNKDYENLIRSVIHGGMIEKKMVETYPFQ
jgi:hypothetical protein